MGVLRVTRTTEERSPVGAAENMFIVLLCGCVVSACVATPDACALGTCAWLAVGRVSARSAWSHTTNMLASLDVVGICACMLKGTVVPEQVSYKRLLVPAVAGNKIASLMRPLDRELEYGSETRKKPRQKQV